MNQKQFFTKKGAIIPFQEYVVKDLVDADQMHKHAPRQLLGMVYDMRGMGYNYKRAMVSLCGIIIREFLTYMVDRCIEHTDRFIFPDRHGTKMFIGVVPHDPNRWVKAWKKNMMNFHSGKKRYGLIFKMNKAIYPYHYYIRMIKEKRINLARHIFRGRQYHDC
jgi:hypothetical protein